MPVDFPSSVRVHCRPVVALVLMLALVFVSTTAGASVALGQTSATLDAGGMYAVYEGSAHTAALTVSPGLRIDRLSLSVDAAGTLSRFADSWSAQTSLAASYFSRALGPLQGEIETSVNGSAQPGGASTGAAGGGLRLHLLNENCGVWLGVLAGRANNGISWRSTVAGDLGGWIRIGDAITVLQLAPSTIGADLRYTDAYTVTRVERGQLELAASVGLRDWRNPIDAATTGWGTLGGMLWLDDHFALTAVGGSYPADWAQGFAGGGYVSVGVRIATRRPTSRQAIAGAIQRTLPPVTQPVTEEFRAEPAPNGEHTLALTAPAADRVEVMGDFTDWQPVPLRRRADGRWSVTLPIAPGAHRLNLRVGAGAWGVPPGLPIVTDEFSGTVAVLTVE